MGDTDREAAEKERTPAEIARDVMRAADRAVLSTALVGASGWPYGSLVLTALDHDATPLLLISRLAEHTKNVEADDRVSLLFDGTAGLDEPLTGARVTVVGRAVRNDEPRYRARFLSRHPSAAGYAGFADFGMFRVTVERAHLVAGFGRIHWIDGADLIFDTGASVALAESEAGIVDHMNADHADAIALYATVLLGRDAGDWRMTGIDPEGCDLRCDGQVARLPFGTAVANAEEARGELVRQVKEARRRAS
ncbi:MAG: heme iron utilization protein [Rhodospirillaceae bacterium]|nr:heme iron utilization protein [Rhodospirillaceae bacterium]